MAAQRTFEAYREARERRDRGRGTPRQANIEGLLRDIHGRDMTHEVQAEVVGDDRFSFIESRVCSDGNGVVASGVCELRDGQVKRETLPSGLGPLACPGARSRGPAQALPRRQRRQ